MIDDISSTTPVGPIRTPGAAAGGGGGCTKQWLLWRVSPGSDARQLIFRVFGGYPPFSTENRWLAHQPAIDTDQMVRWDKKK